MDLWPPRTGWWTKRDADPDDFKPPDETKASVSGVYFSMRMSSSDVWTVGSSLTPAG
jgi:hypothetical protein